MANVLVDNVEQDHNGFTHVKQIFADGVTTAINSAGVVSVIGGGGADLSKVLLTVIGSLVYIGDGDVLLRG